MKPQVCVLHTDGTNCHWETAHAFEIVGAQAQLVHINQLISGEKLLQNFQILVISGGFSYGDDVAAGAILANELSAYQGEKIQRFVQAGKLIIGICNGFQVLVRTGLLPSVQLHPVEAALTLNTSGHFECRWVIMVVQGSPCIFTQGMVGREVTYPVAHGEGRFDAPDPVMQRIVQGAQTVLQYSLNGQPTQEYPANPNGSLNAIAGICDPAGRIFGLMPHPERFVVKTHHPNWRRQDLGEPHGLAIFRNAVNYATQL